MFISLESSFLYKCDSWVCLRGIETVNNYYSLSFRVILIYFHIECQREKEAKAINKFNEDYKPEETDIKVKLPFHKKGTKEIDVSLGISFVQTEICY